MQILEKCQILSAEIFEFWTMYGNYLNFNVKEWKNTLWRFNLQAFLWKSATFCNKNFVAKLKCQHDFKRVALIIQSRYSKSKNINMKLIERIFDLKLAPAWKLWIELKKRKLRCIVEKSNFFWQKTFFFCWNTKEKSDLKFWCWALLSIMLDILQLCLIHKNHSSLNYCNLKSADQFCKFQNDFKKHLNISFAAWCDSKHWNPT